MCRPIAFLRRHSYILLAAGSFLWLTAPVRAFPSQICAEGERCPVCGDGICDADEIHCPADCDPFYGSCGDGLCSGLEDCSSCSSDCGACPTNVCGNGLCQAGETCSS